MIFFFKFKFVLLSIGPRLVEASQLQLTANKIITVCITCSWKRNSDCANVILRGHKGFLLTDITFDT